MLLRRRRLQAGRVPRVAQPRLAVEAAGRLRDGEQQLQRRHALRAGGRQRRRRRAAVGQGQGVYSMPGVTIDGGDPIAVYETVGAAVGARPRRRRPDAGRVQGLPARRPTATSSRRPGCRCTTPSTRRSQCSATARSTRRRCAATRCPRFRARLVERGHAERRARRRDRRGGPRRDGGGRAVRARQPVPRAGSGPQPRLR